MTECGFVLSGPYDGPRCPGVAGLPLPGVEVRLPARDRLGRGERTEVPDDTPGEPLVRSPGLSDGCCQRPADPAAVMVRGHLRSGDIAVREADGMYRIVGRAAVDIIRSRSVRIGAGEIEAVVQDAPGVDEVAVVGVPDPDRGERVVAVVTLRPGTQIDVAAVLRHARATIAPHKGPAAVAVVAEMPQAAPGKFRQTDLIAALADGRLRAATG